MKFVNLYVKSGYSFLSSSLKIDDIISYAKEEKIEALALTDADGLFGAIDFFYKCLKSNIKPIIGMEVTIVDSNQNSSRLLFLVKNLEGYLNLLRITSAINNSERKEAFTLETISEYCDGLIVIIPLLNSSFKALIDLEKDDDIDELINEYCRNFLHLYFGLECYKDEDYKYLEAFRRKKQKFNIQTIALSEVVALSENDIKTTLTLLAIKNGYQNVDIDLANHHFRSLESLEKYFSLEELKASVDILKIIDFDLTAIQAESLVFPLPSDYDKSEYFRQLGLKGLSRRLGKQVPVSYLERLEYEISVIEEMGYIDYFLIVQDYVRFAKKNDILVGPGRGSAACSLVSYVLGITDVDPMKYNLMFERFLNPMRKSMPDIDLDFPDNRRQEVIDYIKEKYSADNVAHIVTYQTFGARSSIRDVAKVLKIESTVYDNLCKMIPWQMDLKEAIEKIPMIANSMEIYQDLFAIAQRIEGLPRQTSLHAAGIIISSKKLEEIIPIMHISGNTVTQYDLNYIESLGLLKMDILGLNNLTIIATTLDMIKKNFDKEIRVSDLDIEDKNALRLICSLNTMGIFQLESEGMKKALKQVQPDSFIEVANVLALFRPGPMDSIPLYAERKNKRDFRYPHKSLVSILESTNGIIVYQEQIIAIVTKFAGLSMAEADLFRRAISKKHSDEFIVLKKAFYQGARKQGIPDSVIDSVYELIAKFASYGFNKAHSVAYAIISMWMANLKFYYLAPFTAALLNQFYGIGSSKQESYISEAKILGINFLPPLANKALEIFNPLDSSTIVFSLNAVKGISGAISKKIIEERTLNGDYRSYIDFLARTYKFIKEDQYRNLIIAGALDEFIDEKINKKTMLGSLQFALIYAEDLSYGASNLGEVPLSSLDISDYQLLALEKEMLGTNIGNIATAVKRKEYLLRGYISSKDLSQQIGKKVSIVLFLKDKRVIKSKKGSYILLGNGFDEFGDVPITMFEENYKKLAWPLVRGELYKFIGIVETYKENHTLIVERIEKVEK